MNSTCGQIQTDLFSLLPRRKLRPKRADGCVQGDTVWVRTEIHATLVTLISMPFTFAFWVLVVAPPTPYPQLSQLTASLKF